MTRSMARLLTNVGLAIPILAIVFTLGTTYHQITAMAEDIESNESEIKGNTRSLTNAEINDANTQVLLERYASQQEDILDILNSLQTSEERQNFIIELLLSQQGISTNQGNTP